MRSFLAKSRMCCTVVKVIIDYTFDKENT